MEFTVKTRGFRELQENLAKLDAAIQKREARAAVRAGAAVLRRQALANARAQFHRQTGALFRAFRVAIKRIGGLFRARIFISPREAFYGPFLIAGWRHIGRGKGRRFQLRHGTIQGKRIAGKPIMDQALEQKAEEAVRVVADRLAQGVANFRGR